MNRKNSMMIETISELLNKCKIKCKIKGTFQYHLYEKLYILFLTLIILLETIFLYFGSFTTIHL